MKHITKNAVKIVLLLALFASAAFADGDMSGGGLAGNGDGADGCEVVSSQPCDESTTDGGQTEDPDGLGSLLNTILEYLELI